MSEIDRIEKMLYKAAQERKITVKPSEQWKQELMLKIEAEGNSFNVVYIGNFYWQVGAAAFLLAALMLSAVLNGDYNPHEQIFMATLFDPFFNI